MTARTSIGSARIDGVGRDDDVVGQAALQTQPGHAERLVLVGELRILRVERATRSRPTARRVSPPYSICAAHDGVVRLGEQGLGPVAA